METFFEDLLDVEELLFLANPQAIVFLAFSLFLFFAAKKVFQLTTSYHLDAALTKDDNKAIAVSFSGYMLGVGLIVYTLIGSDANFRSRGTAGIDMLLDLCSTFLWAMGAIFLLQVARLINDKILLRGFKNLKELVDDRNVGTGAVECGSYIGSAFILHGALTGDDPSVVSAVTSFVIFFLIGQVAFVLFGVLYEKLTAYDLKDEIERDNVAAGVAFGMNLAAIGILISSYIKYSDSLPGLAAWILVSLFLLAATRFIVDRVILPGDALDEEISKDRNWGAAFVEGLAAIGVTLIITASFFSE